MNDAPRLEPGSFASFLAFVWSYRALVVGVPVVAGVVAMIYVLLAPLQYTAHATLMPQERTSGGLLSAMAAGMGGALGDLAGLGGLAGGLGLGGLDVSLQEGVLKSERLADLVEAEFNLSERYRVQKREERLRAWYARLSVDIDDNGLLVMGFRDKDPEFAARVVSRLIEHLDAFNRETRSNLGRRTREFVEQRLVETSARLAEAEQQLVAFQSENQGLALSPSAEAVVEAGAGVLAERMKLETETQVLRNYLSPESPAVRSKEAEMRALDAELGRLPALGSELARLLRERRVVERTYAFLTAQLEEARLEEARNTTTLDVLDPPVAPEEKSHPKRTLTVLAAVFIAGVLSLLAAYLWDAARRVRNSLRPAHDL